MNNLIKITTVKNEDGSEGHQMVINPTQFDQFIETKVAERMAASAEEATSAVSPVASFGSTKLSFKQLEGSEP